MGHIYAIFRNTLLETVRQPVYSLVVVISCAMIAVSPVLSAHIYTFGAGSGMEKSAERMIADLGLATMLLSGLILAVFSSASVIYREIENKTALTVLSKQVSRTAFVFGKYAGVATAIGLAGLTNAFFLLLTLRVGAAVAVSDPVDYIIMACMIATPLVGVTVATFRNYFKGRAWIGSFTFTFMIMTFCLFIVFSTVNKSYSFVLTPSAQPMAEDGAEMVQEETEHTYDWEVARACFLTLLAILVLAGVAVAASTRLDTGGNFIICAFAFLGGLTSKYFHGLSILPGANAIFKLCVGIWYQLIPNLQVFWMSDAITREHAIPNDYMISASMYAVSYIMAMLFLAAFLFQKREIS